MNEKYLDMYAPPPAFSPIGEKINNDHDLVSFINNEINNSKAFLRSQRAWKYAESCMAVLRSDKVKDITYGVSEVVIPKLRRQTREGIAIITNVKPNVNILADEEFETDAAQKEKLFKHWWYSQFVDLKVKEAGQWMGGAGTGYLFLWPDYNYISGELELKVYVLNYKSVLPHHWAVGESVQTIPGVTVRLELPVPTAHRMFPQHCDVITADRNVPSNLKANYTKARRSFRGVVDWFKKQDSVNNAVHNPFPHCDIFITYYEDHSVNRSGKTIIMGEFTPKMQYAVPSYFDYTLKGDGDSDSDDLMINSIPTNLRHIDGTPETRLVTEDDCRLYPNRRMIITTTTGVIYDGPPFYFNRWIPIVPLYVEKPAEEFLGYPMNLDGRTIDRSVNNIARVLEDCAMGKIQPAIAIDSKIPKNEAKRFNPRKAIGQKFQYSMQVIQKAFEPILGYQFYEIDSNAFNVIKFLQEMQDYVVGTNDYTYISRMKQMPAADTQEAYNIAMGTLATDQARYMESSMDMLGKIWLDYSCQIWTTQQVCQILGRDGINLKRWTYDPDLGLNINPLDLRPRWMILREYLKKLNLTATPTTLQERNSYTNKLNLMQLQKMGVEIPNKKLYEAFVEDGQYENSRDAYFAEQEMKAAVAVRIQTIITNIKNEFSPENAMILNVMDRMLGNHNIGRPSGNETLPRTEIHGDQDGIPRPTTATS